MRRICNYSFFFQRNEIILAYFRVENKQHGRFLAGQFEGKYGQNLIKTNSGFTDMYFERP